MEDKDILIGILMAQRNELMNKIAELQMEIIKMKQPKEAMNDNVSQ